MQEPVYIIAYDVGTTGIKTCLYAIETGKVQLIDAEMASYPLYILNNGGAEQDPEDWWKALVNTTVSLAEKANLLFNKIAGISFCSQMQGLVLVDNNGKSLRRAMTYMDQRAGDEMRRVFKHGITIADINVYKLIVSIIETGAVSASAKDPVWKYLWVKREEKEVYNKIYKWLDVKEYLISRMTGSYVMTEDSAFAALIYNNRARNLTWSKKITHMLGVKEEHLPAIMKSTDRAGKLLPEAAAELGLIAGIPVFGGGGDASLIGVGAGAVAVGDTHIYTGTSGWVSTVVKKSMVDTGTMIASIIGAQNDKYNYFAEMETAGKCLEWVKDNLALDLLGIYSKSDLTCESTENTYKNIYDHLTGISATVPPGSNGIIFTPWLHGNRCPFEDAQVRSTFFNLGLGTGKAEMIRAVLEGICFHLRWMLEAQERKIRTSDTIRFVGGGALSDITCQILADITGRRIETVSDPQNVGAAGAAIVAGIGLGIIESFPKSRDIIKPVKVFVPEPANRSTYEKNYSVFRKLYKTNRKFFKVLNEQAL
jgi:xylulokinase